MSSETVPAATYVATRTPAAVPPRQGVGGSVGAQRLADGRASSSQSNLRASGAILLVACYELGHQPLTLASPLAVLRQAGYDPCAVDTSITALDDAAIARARLVAISVPMHTALRLGERVAEHVRAVNPAAHICFYGLYASLNAAYLLRSAADAIIGGEYEQTLLALVQALEHGDPLDVAGVRTREHDAAPVLARLPFLPPAREALPQPERYARLVRDGQAVLAGYVEASRGCLHTCRHCPITPVYGGRFFVVPRNVVLADIRAQVRAGVRHITFGDPDFLNGPGHAMAIVRSLHDEFPDITFDATIKVEHILKRRALFGELAHLGCIFVVSAVESLSEGVLRHLAKGHTRADVVEALAILDDADIPMRPTFVAFTPWTTAADYLELLDFVAEHDLVEAVDPVQYTIRLLVPPGSALLDEADATSWLGPLDEAAFTYTWAHPDPRMDELQRAVAAYVESATRSQRPVTETFEGVRALTGQVLDAPASARTTYRAARRRPVPHLTESWFC